MKRQASSGVSKRARGGDSFVSDRENSTSGDKSAAVVRAIRSLPTGKVSSYGAIAKAAGWAGASRQVVRILRQVPGLPWHRVVGAGGAIRIPGEGGAEQRFRLRMEGVAFRGARVDMKHHEFDFGASSAKARHANRKSNSSNKKITSKRK